MDTTELIARNGDAVRQAVELGDIVHMGTASAERTDAFCCLYRILLMGKNDLNGTIEYLIWRIILVLYACQTASPWIPPS